MGLPAGVVAAGCGGHHGAPLVSRAVGVDQPEICCDNRCAGEARTRHPDHGPASNKGAGISNPCRTDGPPTPAEREKNNLVRRKCRVPQGRKPVDVIQRLRRAVEVGVRGYRSSERADVHDLAVDIDHDGATARTAPDPKRMWAPGTIRSGLRASSRKVQGRPASSVVFRSTTRSSSRLVLIGPPRCRRRRRRGNTRARSGPNRETVKEVLRLAAGEGAAIGESMEPIATRPYGGQRGVVEEDASKGTGQLSGGGGLRRDPGPRSRRRHAQAHSASSAPRDATHIRDWFDRLTSPPGRIGARSVAHELLSGAPVGRLRAVDYHMRERSAWSVPTGQGLRPADIDSIVGHDQTRWRLLGLCSMHRDGHVRERSHELLSTSPPPVVIPFVLLRCDDWVESRSEEPHERVRATSPRRGTRDDRAMRGD